MGFKINNLCRFDEFEIDPANRTLTHGERPVALPARAFDLLLYMVGNPQRLLPKEELMRAVWGATAVEESNLTQSVFLLRKALSANQFGDSNKLIVTVPGRGYRFACEVEHAIGLGPSPADPPPLKVPPAQTNSPPVFPSRRWAVQAAVAATILAAALLYSFRSRPLPGPLPQPHPVTTNTADDPVSTDSLSPDGRYLAYADPKYVTIRTLASGETRSISLGDGVTPLRVEWYPDGTRLLIVEMVADSPRIVVFSILSGKLSPLREDALTPAVSPDGSHVLYTVGSHRELWLMDGNGENPRRILTVNAPDKIYAMFWSPDRLRVWFARVHWDKDHEAITLETCDLKGAAQTVVLSDDRMSAFRLVSGERLFYALREGPQNFTSLWELPVNSTKGEPQGAGRKVSNWTGFSISGISATADGKHLALLNGTWQSDIFVGDLGAGGATLANARRLTLDLSDDSPAFWTQDDRAVVFESTRNGRSQIFRQRLDQTVPELLSTDAEEDVFSRFGGPWIYFHSVPVGGRMAWSQPLRIRRIPGDGGASADVLTDAGVDIDCAAARPEICVMARLKGKTLAFYHFDHSKGPGAQIGKMDFDSRLFPSFAVSPDGSEIAAVDASGAGNRIRRLPLNGGDCTEVELRGRKGIEVLYWAADGKGWFVSTTTPSNGDYLLHVSLKGESQVLFEQPEDGRDTWGVPSHDGKRLAFLKWTSSRNVWMIDM